MEEKIPLQIDIMEDGLSKVKFTGERQINNIIDCWLEIQHVVNESCSRLLVLDCMTEKLSAEGICLIIELLSEYHFYLQTKIAIVLVNADSYNTRFFDIFAKHWGINTKHFNNETEALIWLLA